MGVGGYWVIVSKQFSLKEKIIEAFPIIIIFFDKKVEVLTPASQVVSSRQCSQSEVFMIILMIIIMIILTIIINMYGCNHYQS